MEQDLVLERPPAGLSDWKEDKSLDLLAETGSEVIEDQ